VGADRPGRDAVAGPVRGVAGHAGEKAAAELRHPRGIHRLETQTAGLLDRAPLPAAHQPPVPAWRAELAEAARAYLTDARPAAKKGDALDDLRRKHEEAKVDARARRDYVEARARMVEEKGEEFTRNLELRTFHDGKPFGVDPAQLIRGLS
jgi:hypothetical protein